MPRTKAKPAAAKARKPREVPPLDLSLPVPFEVRASATIKQRWGEVADAARKGVAQVTTQHGRPDLVVISVTDLQALASGLPLDVRQGLLDRYLALFEQARSRLQVLHGAPSLSQAFQGTAQELGLSFRAGSPKRP